MIEKIKSREKPKPIYDSEKYWYRKFWSIVLLVVLLVFGLKCVSIALTTPFSFDGSQTAQVARSLAENGSHTTTYDHLVLFDPIITTGLPMILPVALSFRLFGSTFSAGLMVNALYAWLFIVAVVWYLCRSLRLHPFYALIALVLLVVTPQLDIWAFGLYGEMPMLFYLMVVAILLQRFETFRIQKTLFWAGLCLGLAVLTKVISLIALPAAAITIFCVRFWSCECRIEGANGFKVLVLDLLVFALGLLLPIIGYEIYQLLVLREDLYLHRLSQRVAFFTSHPSLLENQNSITNLIRKSLSHFQRLSSYIGIEPRVAVQLILVVIMSLGLDMTIIFSGMNRVLGNYRQRSSISASRIFLVIFILILLGWWLFLTASPWERYIFPGILLLEVLIVSIFGMVSKGESYFQSNFIGFRTSAFHLILIIIVILLMATWGIQSFRQGTYKISFEEKEEKIGYLQAAAFIQGLPEDARIFGYGWWQAPVLSFAADTQFYDFYSHPELLIPGKLEDTYLVSDRYAAYINPESLQSVLSNFEYELVYHDKPNELSIYQLTKKP